MAIILGPDDAKDWFYKGEGAANLVLGYRGSSPSLVSKVLRIQKLPKGENRLTNDCRALSAHEQLLWRDVGELVDATSKDAAGRVFMMQVMSPLLGAEHIDCGTQIIVSRKFLEFVEKNVRSQRPAWRISAADIDTLSSTGLLISDHSLFSNGFVAEDTCFAVELKPKCGFLPTTEFIAERNAIKKHTTRFRMHQLLKLHKGEISEISHYDPLDLFSGSRERISQAVMALLTTPQNNFRIFFNGSLIFGGLGGGTSNSEYKGEPSPVVNRTIEDQLKVLIHNISGLQLASFIDLVTEAIVQSGILDRLLAAQKLDVFDIEGAIHLYYNIISQPCLVCKSASNVELLHQYSLLHSFSLEESLKIVREYLIAATAKDCSLIISFRPREYGDMVCNSLCLKSSDQNFEFKANFIDLDLKPLEKMVYYYKLDQKIVDFYANSKEIEGRVSNSTSGSAKQTQMQC